MVGVASGRCVEARDRPHVIKKTEETLGVSQVAYMGFGHCPHVIKKNPELRRRLVGHPVAGSLRRYGGSVAGRGDESDECEVSLTRMGETKERGQP
jgi:hypothetical protein